MKARDIVTFGAMVWGVTASVAFLWVLLRGWINPNHLVTIALNPYNEMWIEIPLLMFLFGCAVIWGLYQMEDDL